MDRVTGICVLAALALWPSDAAQGETWDELVQAALKEGEVTIQTAPGRAYELGMAEGFRKAFPGIKVNFNGGSTSTLIPVILREREASVYKWDVLIGGAPSGFPTLKARGVYTPLKPFLLLPELLEDKTWAGGFDFGWLDREKTYSYGFDFTTEQTVYVNRDFIPRNVFNDAKDILSVKFAGKIVWDDPRTTGEGIFASQAFYNNFGEEFLNKLFAEQQIVYSTNRRQNAEWMALGRYPIGLGISIDDLALLQQNGVGKNVETFSDGLDKPSGGSGFGVLQVFDKAAHPNAAKLYVNWLLSKQGQQSYSEFTRRNSRRLDVAPVAPENAPKPGTIYVNAQSEEQMPVRDKVIAIAKAKISAVGR